MQRSYRNATTDTLNSSFSQVRLILRILGFHGEELNSLLWEVDKMWGFGCLDAAICRAVENLYMIRVKDFGDHGFVVYDILEENGDEVVLCHSPLSGIPLTPMSNS